MPDIEVQLEEMLDRIDDLVLASQALHDRQDAVLLAPEQIVADHQTYVDTSKAWADTAEDTLVPVEFGGDGASDYSALHWAAKAEASAQAAAGAVLPITNAIIFYGAWDASTGAPPTPGANQYPWYRISVAGNIDSVGYDVDDSLLWNGTAWYKVGGSGSGGGSVISVAGKQGVVTLEMADIAGLQTSIDGLATSAQGANADSAYAWGDHSLVGYLTAVSWADVSSKPSEF
ncbi:MAG: hypothetical protein AAGI44_02305, partial [Pseudomonadota bacterium]